MGAIFTAEDSKEIRDGKLTGDWGRHWLCNSSAQGPVTKSTSENKMHICHLNPIPAHGFNYFGLDASGIDLTEGASIVNQPCLNFI